MTKIIPIVTEQELAADVAIIEKYLETLIPAGDEMSKVAFDLRYGKKIDGKDAVDFRSMMTIARRYAYQLDDTSLADFEPIGDQLEVALHDHLAREPSVSAAMHKLDCMTPVVTVGLMALARSTIMQEPGEILTSFRYVRCLARMGEEDCQAALDDTEISVYPYPWSSNELDEVDQGTYTFLAGYLADGDIREWLMSTPGFIPDIMQREPVQLHG